MGAKKLKKKDFFFFDSRAHLTIEFLIFSSFGSSSESIGIFACPCGKFDKRHLRGEPLFERISPTGWVQRVEEITVQTSKLTKYIIQ